jgi:hypothetical protein
MRHGTDHIHIVATLVRQDRRTNWARNDWPLAQAACRELEDRYDRDGAVAVRLRPSKVHTGEFTGYSVGLAGDITSGGDPIRFEVRVGSPPAMTPGTSPGSEPHPSEAPLPSATGAGGELPVTGGGVGWIGIVSLGGSAALLAGGAVLWLVNARRRRCEV